MRELNGPVFIGGEDVFNIAARGRGLQAAGWFVTTVKQATALEALARRRLGRVWIFQTF
jgi:hypothetical protein